jgi:ABC-type lipoprotein release transport system permease subunit
MALGAEQQAVKQMFVRHGLLLAGIGVVCVSKSALSIPSRIVPYAQVWLWLPWWRAMCPRGK